MSRYHFIFTLLFSSLLVGPIAADEPATLYIFPAGGQRGTDVTVRVGGMALHESCAWSMIGTGVKASPRLRLTDTIWFEGPVIPMPDSQRAENYPRDYAAQVKLDAAAPLGTRWWRVSNSQGVTPALRFMVGDLPEIIEQEIDGEPLAVPVKLPVTINGRTFPREDVDLWSFTARRGETIRCEVHAARLGSPLDSQLEILDAAGRRLASNGDHFDSDSLIVFTAPADGEYRVRIYDAAFGGLQTHVYRLTLSAEPYVFSSYPLGGRRGSTTSFELAGVNLPAKLPPIAIPADAPTDWSHALRIADRPTNPIVFETSDLAEALESEPNDEVATAGKLAVSMVANGRIDHPGDVDRWRVELKKGENVQLELRAGRLGSPLDSVVAIENSAGKELLRNDDISGTESDSSLKFTAPADGVYHVSVQERHAARGGREFAYRLHVTPAGEPDFRLTMTTEALTLYRDGQVRLKVQAQRLNGFAESITILMDDLPPGVTLTGGTIGKGAPQADVTLKATADAKIELRQIVVRGVAKVGENELSRRAVYNVERGESPLDVLNLAVSMPTPFKIVGVFQLPYASRGSKFRRYYRLERGGFTGPLEVSLAEKQMRHLQGVTGPTMTIPGEADEFTYTASLAPWMELSRTSRSLISAVGIVDDGQGNKHQVCFSSPHQNEQISLIVVPSPLNVELGTKVITADAAQPQELEVSIDRPAGISGPVKIELVAAPHQRGISAEPIVIPPMAEQGRLTIRFQADAGPFNLPLTIRATHGSGDEQLINEAKLDVIR